MKNSSDNIGNRTRNLPVCSAVPHPKRHSMSVRTHAVTRLPVEELEKIMLEHFTKTQKIVHVWLNSDTIIGYFALRQT
jgi:hypothetical protein